MPYLRIKVLTTRYLTTSLVLNNLAQTAKDALVDLSLRWAHVSEGPLSDVVAHIFSSYSVSVHMKPVLKQIL